MLPTGGCYAWVGSQRAAITEVNLWTKVGLPLPSVKWKSLSRVRLFVTPWTVACQAPLSMEFSRPEYLSGVAVPFSRGSSKPRDRTQVSCTAGGFFTAWATREAHPWPQSSCKICSQKPPCTGAWELAFPAQPCSCHRQRGVHTVPGSNSAVL